MIQKLIGDVTRKQKEKAGAFFYLFCRLIGEGPPGSMIDEGFSVLFKSLVQETLFISHIYTYTHCHSLSRALASHSSMEFQKIESPKPNKDQVVITMGMEHPKTKTLKRLHHSKPRSRFEEINYPNIPAPQKPILESEESHSPSENPNYSTTTDDDDEEEEWLEYGEDVEESMGKYRKKMKRRMKKRAIIEWSLFLIIMTCLVCSLTVESLRKKLQWGLHVWKWCLMVMVIFCGRLVSGWVVRVAVFLIERNFMLREKVLYFVYGLRKSFQNCVWLGLVLVAWMIMFHDVHRRHKVLKKFFRALVAVLMGATIWLLKIVFVKVLASSFHVATFFDRMKESVFHHYVLEALSGPPLDDADRDLPTQQRHMQASKSLPARLR